MPSLADLLRFSLRPFSPFDLAPGSTTAPPWFPDALSEYLMSLGPRGVAASNPLLDENLAAPAGRPPSGDVPAPQVEMPALPPAASLSNLAPPVSTGGILGGHPTVGLGVEAAAQSRGILGSLFDAPQSGSGQALGSPYPSSNLQKADLIGTYRLPIFDPHFGSFGSSARLSSRGLGSNPLTIPDSVDAAPRVSPVALLNRPFTDQAFSQKQNLTDREYPQAGDVVDVEPPLDTNVIPPQSLQPRSAADARREYPNAETYKKFNISALLHHHPDTAGTDVRLDDNWFQPSASSAGERDWSAYLQPAQVIDPSAITGDPRIDRTTEILLDTLVEAVKELGVEPSAPMRSSLFGTLAHSHFARKVRALDLPGIGEDGVEQNWHLGEALKYGPSGAKRTDIYLRDPLRRPIAIYDLKTGNARLTDARIRELQEAVKAGNIPVIELRWRDVMALQR